MAKLSYLKWLKLIVGTRRSIATAIIELEILRLQVNSVFETILDQV